MVSCWFGGLSPLLLSGGDLESSAFFREKLFWPDDHDHDHDNDHDCEGLERNLLGASSSPYHVCRGGVFVKKKYIQLFTQ